MSEKPETAGGKPPKNVGKPSTRPETGVAQPPEIPRMSLDKIIGLAAGDKAVLFGQEQPSFSPLFVATVAAVAGALVAKCSDATPGKGQIPRTALEWSIHTAIAAGRLAEETALEPPPAAECPWAFLREGPSDDLQAVANVEPGPVYVSPREHLDPLPR